MMTCHPKQLAICLFTGILSASCLGCKATTQPKTRTPNSTGWCLSPNKKPTKPTIPRTKKPTIRILTFNVNYGGNPTLGYRRILQAKADMIALQETTPRWEQALPKQLRKQYKWIRFHHAGGAGGMAFLSKYPVLSSQLLSPPKGGWFTAWKLQIKTPIGQTDILNVHLRPPLPANGKLSSIPKAYLFHTPAIRKRELQTYLGNQPPTQHTIVLGDFNENRHGKAFRWLRKTHHMKSALAAFDRTSYTWYWPTRYWTFKDRYDHIMHSTTLQATHAAVLPDGGSDHRPVLAVFQQHTKK